MFFKYNINKNIILNWFVTFFVLEVFILIAIDEVGQQVLGYLFLFFLFVSALKYLLVAFGVFDFMGRRKIKCRFLAFVPVVNSSYCLASVSDSINSDYFNKTNSRLVLLMLKLIFLGSVFILVQAIRNQLPDFKFKLVGLIIGDYYVYDLLRVFYSSRVACYILAFTLIIAIIYLIYLFKIYYNIFSEYGGSYSKLMFFGSIVSYIFFKFYFFPDLFIYLIRKRTSKFEELNKVKNFL